MTKNKRAPFRMFTVNEAADYYALPKHFVRQLVVTGEIPSVKAGKKYLINEKILEKYLHDGVSCDKMSAQDYQAVT
jgi:excisionase family DNA binding protein